MALTMWLIHLLFQSTPLREGRLIAHPRQRGLRVFQSTPLREGRRKPAIVNRWRLRFNPRPCVRGDAFVDCYCCITDCFNPRPCVRGDSPSFRSQNQKDKPSNSANVLTKLPLSTLHCHSTSHKFIVFRWLM